ncbi:histidine phosphatase family protein [Micromonospora sp. NPDC050417]|uniref:histidine phosphatase family protein n=1 Tax=Micromonospora sp. NPDC050417 TaxID=3364280 RepID=UPI0037BA66FA
MSDRVLWMRHGTCLDGLCRPHAHARPDTPLTTRGVAEVISTARWLLDRNARPNVILTSTLLRATMSAGILAEILNVPIAPPNPLYAEWRAPDCVLGLSPDEYPREYQAWRSERLRDPDSALHGGESLTALRQRALEAVSRANEAAQQGVALIVSHRVFIGALAANLNGVRSPQDTFQAARDFRLGPAMVWPACPTPRAGPPRWR